MSSNNDLSNSPRPTQQKLTISNNRAKSSKNKFFTREFLELLELFLVLPAYLFFSFGTLYLIFGGVFLIADYFSDGYVPSHYLTYYFVILFIWLLSTFFLSRQVGLKKLIQSLAWQNEHLSGNSRKYYDWLVYGFFLVALFVAAKLLLPLLLQ